MSTTRITTLPDCQEIIDLFVTYPGAEALDGAKFYGDGTTDEVCLIVELSEPRSLTTSPVFPTVPWKVEP